MACKPSDGAPEPGVALRADRLVAVAGHAFLNQLGNSYPLDTPSMWHQA